MMWGLLVLASVVQDILLQGVLWSLASLSLPDMTFDLFALVCSHDTITSDFWVLALDCLQDDTPRSLLALDLVW